MQEKKQSKVWQLSKVEYEMIASFLWCDVNEVRNIYERFSFEGLGSILLSNAYLIKNGMVMGRISDLGSMLKSYSNNGLKILNYLFSSKFFEKKGSLYYSMDQLLAMNKYKMISEKFIAKEKEELKHRHTVFPPKKYINTSYIKKVFNNIIEHVDRRLPEHIRNEISMHNSSVKGFNIENFYRILNSYISIDSSFIGFTELLNIQLNILHKDKLQLMQVLNNTGVWNYDSSYGIIYDPIQRAATGHKPEPSTEEIRQTINRRMERYTEIINLK